MRDHVIYESRLELARLLFADCDPSVHRIVAQPFLLKAVQEGKVRKHIPDYLLITEQGPVVVDVKPLRRLSKPEAVFTFEWTRQMVESRGVEVPRSRASRRTTELENIRFLAGYSRDWLFSLELLDELRCAEIDGVPLGQAMCCLPNRPEPQVRSAIHHLFWTRHLVTDLDQPLSISRVLTRAA
jgi:hypothetical protein